MRFDAPRPRYGWCCPHSVSYTHLDVYKRQVQGCIRPLATRYSLLATRYSPLATRHSPLATRHPLGQIPHTQDTPSTR